MRIAAVRAYSLTVPVPVSSRAPERKSVLTACVARIESEDGLVGEGITTLEAGLEGSGLVADAINVVIGPALVGEPILEIERHYEQIFWKVSPRGQGGIAFNILSVLDTALWDLAAQSLGQPLWRLMGGARREVPVYATFGFPQYTSDELAAAAVAAKNDGYTRLKMVVGSGALRDRHRNGGLEAVVREDVRRVAAVREAIGDEASLYIDANCSLDPYHALKLARAVQEYDLAWFEEPVAYNDVRALADLRSKVSIPVAVGQNESLPYRFNDLLASGAVDVIQPSVVRSGGFTGTRRAAAVADAYGRQISNGGGWHLHNLPILAGLGNGYLAECHLGVAGFYEMLFHPVPSPVDGKLTVTDEPGLGVRLDWDRVDEFTTKRT